MGLPEYKDVSRKQGTQYGNIVAGLDEHNEAHILKTDEGGKIDITQSDLFSVFTSLLREVKKMNMYLSFITSVEIKNTDVEG